MIPPVINNLSGKRVSGGGGHYKDYLVDKADINDKTGISAL